MATLLIDKGRDYRRVRQSPKERLQLVQKGFVPVLSSNVSAISRNVKNLIVRFHGGATYSYRNQGDLFDDMLRSSSKGKFVWRNLIRKGVPYNKITSVPLERDSDFTDRDIQEAAEDIREMKIFNVEIVTVADLKRMNLVIQNRSKFITEGKQLTVSKETMKEMLVDKADERLSQTIQQNIEEVEQVDVSYEEVGGIWEEKGFDKTYNNLVAKFKDSDKKYGYDEKRENIAYLYRNQQRLFPKIRIKKVRAGQEYAARFQTVSINNWDDTKDLKSEHLGTVAHEFGHAFDNQIANKIGLKNKYISSIDRWQLERIDIVKKNARKLRMSKSEVDAYIKREITDKFQAEIDKLNPEQKSIYDAGVNFSKEVQNIIKDKNLVLKDKITFNKVIEFDKKRTSMKQEVRDELGMDELLDKKLQLSKKGRSLLDSGAPEEEILKVRKEYNVVKKQLEMKSEIYDKMYLQRKKEYFEENGHLGDVSDIYDALSLGRLQENRVVGYGHGRKYYKTNTGSSENEIFSHLGTLQMNNKETYDEVKKDFPKLVNAYENVMDKSVEYLKKE